MGGPSDLWHKTLNQAFVTVALNRLSATLYSPFFQVNTLLAPLVFAYLANAGIKRGPHTLIRAGLLATERLGWIYFNLEVLHDGDSGTLHKQVNQK